MSLMFSRQRGWQLRSEFYLHPQGLVPGCRDGIAGHKAVNIDLSIPKDGKSRDPSISVSKENSCLAHTQTPNCFATLAPALQ